MWVLVEEGVTYCSYVAPSTFQSQRVGFRYGKSASQKRRSAIVLQGQWRAKSLLRIEEGRRASDPADEHRPQAVPVREAWLASRTLELARAP
jgi:hypothetical protein